MLTVRAVDVALTAAGDCLSILSVIDPVPLLRIVFFLPVARIRYLSHFLLLFYSGGHHVQREA